VDSRNSPQSQHQKELETLHKRVAELEAYEAQIHKALFDSQKRFYALADSLPETVYETDSSGTFTYLNRTGRKLFGFTSEEISQGIHSLSIIAPEDRERGQVNLQKRLSGVPGHPIEYTAIKKNGSRISIIIHAMPIMEKETCIGTRGLMIDITARKNVEAELLKSEERFRILTENTSDWIWEIDENAVFTYVNPKVKDLLGFNPEEVIGKTLFDFMTLGDAVRLKNRFRTILKTRKPFKLLENSNLHKDGHLVILESSGVPIFDENGNFRGFRGIDRDITEPKTAEDKLRESEERLRLLVENIPDIIVRIDLNGTVLAVNRTATGVPPETIVGKDIQQFAAPKHQEDLLKNIERAFKTGRSSMHQFLGMGPGGNYDAWYELRIVPVKHAHETAGVTLIATDITERKKIQQEKERLQARLQIAEKMETVAILAGGVAHDLNNILASIVSYPDLLLLELPKNSPLRQPIITIQESGQKAAAIVQDLLALSRKGFPVTEVLNINTVVNEYLASLVFQKLKIDYPAIVFETELDPQVLNVRGSAIHISKIILNLVSNATAAINGAGKITIGTTNRYIDKPIFGYDTIQKGDYILLSVSDTGCGIPEDEIERIFEPFYTKKSRGACGTGLGLAIVWGTVKDHFGYIDVTSTPGAGTTFDIYLPATKEKTARKEHKVLCKDFMGNGEKILVIDDAKEQREISCLLLSKLGYCPIPASCGEEAVEYLKQNTVHLLMLDMIMDPGIDGLETYKKIIQLHPNQKAIIVSGYAETDRVREAHKLGAGQYIKKPYTVENLAQAIKTELGK